MPDGFQLDVFGAAVPVSDVGAVDTPKPPRRTRGERQRQAVLRGVHPLTGDAVHPRAPEDASDPQALGLRCGSCDFLTRRIAANGKAYPKCTGHRGKYLSSSAATDVRAWWPACPSHTPRPKESSR